MNTSKKLKLYYTPRYSFIITAWGRVVWYEKNVGFTWTSFGNALIKLQEEIKLYKEMHKGVEIFIFHIGIIECIKAKKPPRKVRRALANFGYHPNKIEVPSTKIWDELINTLKFCNFSTY